MYCRYFTAKILKEKTWLLTGLLKNEESIALERALDPRSGLFEFFVPQEQVDNFLKFMSAVEKLGLILSPVVECKNRIEQQSSYK